MFRSRIYAILDMRADTDAAGIVCNYGLLLLIFANVAAVMLESVESIYSGREIWFNSFETFSIAVFTLEYILRLWSSPEAQAGAFGSDLQLRLRYAFSPMALIDLLAILPFYIAFLVPIDLRFLRVLRLVRLLKLSRYSRSLELLSRVLREEAKPIGAALFVLGLLLVVTASLAYLAEKEVQPDAFGSIPQSMWWAVVTMTTVGYGDVTPVTTLGKFIAALVGILGIGMVALPAGLLASGFNRELHKRASAYRSLVDRALDDGTITAAERVNLARARDQLGLSIDQADQILRVGRQRAHRTPGCCPHCGHTLAEPSLDKLSSAQT